tara:strand:+ start:30 stop:614 length:585 start_codon:yes stop_codon:yes gene_type:complete
MASITSFPSGVSGSSLVLISTQTASSSANINFTSGIDSTYKEYIFKFIDIHPQNEEANFTFNLSVDGGSNYNVAKTSTFFRAFHLEDDSSQNLYYTNGGDLAQGTGVQNLTHDGIGNGNDECFAGTLHLFDPSSTTFVKHYMSSASVNAYQVNYGIYNTYCAGYGNTTSAIDAIQFKMSSGNIDTGTIKMYGVV